MLFRGYIILGLLSFLIWVFCLSFMNVVQNGWGNRPAPKIGNHHDVLNLTSKADFIAAWRAGELPSSRDFYGLQFDGGMLDLGELSPVSYFVRHTAMAGSWDGGPWLGTQYTRKGYGVNRFQRGGEQKWFTSRISESYFDGELALVHDYAEGDSWWWGKVRRRAFGLATAPPAAPPTPRLRPAYAPRPLSFSAHAALGPARCSACGRSFARSRRGSSSGSPGCASAEGCSTRCARRPGAPTPTRLAAPSPRAPPRARRPSHLTSPPHWQVPFVLMHRDGKDDLTFHFDHSNEKGEQVMRAEKGWAPPHDEL